MKDRTTRVPINADGTIHDRLGQARVVAPCHAHAGITGDARAAVGSVAATT